LKRKHEFLQSIVDEELQLYLAERIFLVQFKDEYFLLYANNLLEVCDYLNKKYSSSLVQPFSIIDITNANYKVLNNPKYIEKILKRIKELFIVTPL